MVYLSCNKGISNGMETRSLESQFDSIVRKRKVLVIYGARRVGKTSVVEEFLFY